MVSEYVELTRQLRHCARCGVPTLWAGTTQLSSNRGLCLDHAGVRPCRDAPADLRTALAIITAALGEVSKGATEAPQTAPEPRRVVGRWLVTGKGWRITERPMGGPTEGHRNG